MRCNLYVIFLLSVFSVKAQKDTVNALSEVVLYGNFTPARQSGFSLQVITDSVLKEKPVSLGVLLQERANLYFKQNGNGMVSSISFRGTTAAQTGVYWNEIPVNSALNGQTDFNTVNVTGFDAVEVRAGGGSALLGSGAIGGAINLIDKLSFNNTRNLSANMGYGSYHTLTGFALGSYSTDKFSLKLSGNYNKSTNDYPFLGTDLYNENGQYKNYGFQGVFAWKNRQNIVSIHSYYQNNDRNTSRTLTAESNAKLLNKAQRVLLNWKFLGDRFTSDLKTALLDEDYSYIFDQKYPDRSGGRSQNTIVKYDFTYFLSSIISLKTGFIYNHAKGSGDNISEKNRDDFEAYVLLHHNILPKMAYNLSFRKGISSEYAVPFIYAFDIYYQLSHSWKIKTNLTSNYRLPTFNDLYWVPGGNSDLKPEKNRSGEFGVVFDSKFLTAELTSYYLKTNEMIQWVPGDDGIWSPRNIKDVLGYGMEFAIGKQMQWGKHGLQTKIQYAYTVSEDAETGKQLIYVPFHKGNLLLQYDFARLYFHYNLQYSGDVFTTSTNTRTLEGYWLSNLDLGYRFFDAKMQLALRINNLFNTAYQSVAYRPMPDRNFNFSINYKFL